MVSHATGIVKPVRGGLFSTAAFHSNVSRPVFELERVQGFVFLRAKLLGFPPGEIADTFCSVSVVECFRGSLESPPVYAIRCRNSHARPPEIGP